MRILILTLKFHESRVLFSNLLTLLLKILQTLSSSGQISVFCYSGVCRRETRLRRFIRPRQLSKILTACPCWKLQTVSKRYNADTLPAQVPTSRIDQQSLKSPCHQCNLGNTEHHVVQSNWSTGNICPTVLEQRPSPHRLTNCRKIWRRTNTLTTGKRT